MARCEWRRRERRRRGGVLSERDETPPFRRVPRLRSSTLSTANLLLPPLLDFDTSPPLLSFERPSNLKAVDSRTSLAQTSTRIRFLLPAPLIIDILSNPPSNNTHLPTRINNFDISTASALPLRLTLPRRTKAIPLLFWVRLVFFRVACIPYPCSSHHSSSSPLQLRNLYDRSTTNSKISCTGSERLSPSIVPRSKRLTFAFPACLSRTSDYISLDIDSSNPPTFLLPPHKQPTPVPYTVPVAPRQTSHHVHPARFAYQAPPPPQNFEEDTYDSEGGREHVGLVYAGEDMVVGEGQYASVVGTTGEDLDGFVAIPSLPPLPSFEEGRYSEGGEDQQYPVASSSSRLYCQESRGE